jgi:hypothetical protein
MRNEWHPFPKASSLPTKRLKLVSFTLFSNNTPLQQCNMRTYRFESPLFLELRDICSSLARSLSFNVSAVAGQTNNCGDMGIGCIASGNY